MVISNVPETHFRNNLTRLVNVVVMPEVLENWVKSVILLRYQLDPTVNPGDVTKMTSIWTDFKLAARQFKANRKELNKRTVAKMNLSQRKAEVKEEDVAAAEQPGEQEAADLQEAEAKKAEEKKKAQQRASEVMDKLFAGRVVDDNEEDEA